MKRVFVVLLAVMVMVVWASFGYAQDIKVCVKKDGEMRLVDGPSDCKKHESFLSWPGSTPSPPPPLAPNLNGIEWKGMSIAGYNDIVGIADHDVPPGGNMNVIYALGADRPCRFRVSNLHMDTTSTTYPRSFTADVSSCHGPDSLVEATIDSSCNVHFKTVSNVEFFGKITGQMLFGTIKDLGFPNPEWPSGMIQDDIHGYCPGYGTRDFPKARDGILIARSVIPDLITPSNPGTPTITPGCE